MAATTFEKLPGLQPRHRELPLTTLKVPGLQGVWAVPAAVVGGSAACTLLLAPRRRRSNSGRTESMNVYHHWEAGGRHQRCSFSWQACEQGPVRRPIHHLLGPAQVQHPRLFIRFFPGLLSCDVGTILTPQESVAQGSCIAQLAAESKHVPHVVHGCDCIAILANPLDEVGVEAPDGLGTPPYRDAQKWGGARGCPRRWPQARGRRGARKGAWR